MTGGRASARLRALDHADFLQLAQPLYEQRGRHLLGIHFRFADTAGRKQAQRVADWTFNHYLLPLRK